MIEVAQGSRARRLLFISSGLLVVFAAVLMSLTLYMRLFAGRVQNQLFSPDGRNIAEYRIYEFVPAMDAAQSAVQLRTKLNPFRHTVFAGANYGADVTIAWIDSRTLLIKCLKCSNFERDTMEQKWDDVSIRYDLQ